MLFNSATYLGFLVLVVLLHWRIPKSWRPVFLLAASYAFYASWSAPYLLLILALTVANYGIGLIQAGRTPRSRGLAATGIALNLGALATFKYLGLLDESARSFAGVLGLPFEFAPIQLLLPIGLSFFTFEFIHYQVDLYRGGEAMRDPVHFALFPAFFPTQIAGPIKRYQDFGRQIRLQPSFQAVRAWEGVELIALGLFKKVVLADTLLPIADKVFADPSQAGLIEAWSGLIAFSFQIYLDFSGYTDIGRGSAQLLGYTVPQNFHSPYLATSLRDFWRRWHMTLSLWLRDYLYIPLGGSRLGARRTKVNLLLTMALGGLWHGAAWHFLLWGVGHGSVLALERVSEDRRSRIRLPRWARVGSSWLATQLAVLLLWSLFRSPAPDVALQLWGRLAGGPLSTGLVPWLPVLLISTGVLIVETLPERWHLSTLLRAQPGAFVARPISILAIGALVAVWVTLYGVTQSFIYFQF